MLIYSIYYVEKITFMRTVIFFAHKNAPHTKKGSICNLENIKKNSVSMIITSENEDKAPGNTGLQTQKITTRDEVFGAARTVVAPRAVAPIATAF